MQGSAQAPAPRKPPPPTTAPAPRGARWHRCATSTALTHSKVLAEIKHLRVHSEAAGRGRGRRSNERRTPAKRASPARCPRAQPPGSPGAARTLSFVTPYTRPRMPSCTSASSISDRREAPSRYTNVPAPAQRHVSVAEFITAHAHALAPAASGPIWKTMLRSICAEKQPGRDEGRVSHCSWRRPRLTSTMTLSLVGLRGAAIGTER